MKYLVLAFVVFGIGYAIVYSCENQAAAQFSAPTGTPLNPFCQWITTVL
jgi:hypothetical protein